MSNITHAAADVHSASTTFSAINDDGAFVFTCTVPTTSQALVAAIQAIPGTVHLAFEEGTHAAWFYDLAKPYVAKVIACEPRHNRLLKVGNKSDGVDADKLCELLRLGSLKPVYHGEHGTARLKQLVKAYDTLVRSSVRGMNQVKVLFRSRGIDTEGKDVYGQAHRADWLAKLPGNGTKDRALWLLRLRDQAEALRGEALAAVLLEAKKHKAWKLLQTVPGIGEIRAAYIVAYLDTPFRFRTKRQLWAYVGLAVVTRSTADYRRVKDGLKKKRRAVTRGLNKNHHPTLKFVFMSAASEATKTRSSLYPYYQRLLTSGLAPEMARLTLARKIVAICLAIWKKGERFNPEIALTRTPSR